MGPGPQNWVSCNKTPHQSQGDIFVSRKMGGSPAGTPLLPDHQLELQIADCTACLPVGTGQCVRKHPDTHVWSWELGTVTTFGFGQANRATPVPMPRKDLPHSLGPFPKVSAVSPPPGCLTSRLLNKVTAFSSHHS